LPLILIASLVVVLLYAAREAILPAMDVHVVPVVTRPSTAASAPQFQESGAVLAQAPGWVEPEPYAIIVQSLVAGVVKEVHVLEGETIAAGDVVATLIGEDAVLEVERTQAETAVAQAALSRAHAEEEVARARIDEMQDEVDRKRPLVAIGGVSEGEFARLELRLKALAAELNVAAAAAQAAQASAHRAGVMQREAELSLSRTTVRSPVSGVVLTRSVVPGSLVSLSMNSTSEQPALGLVSVYDPARLQVRAEVPLADFGKIGVGTLAEVTTEAMPGVTVYGKVIRIVHEADIQRNTVQVKVLLDNPPDVLKPDMLTRVRFVSGGQAGTPANDDMASASSAAGLELFAPVEAVMDRSGEPFVWIAALSNAGSAPTAQRRAVTLGNELPNGYVQVITGVNPGDRLITHAPPDLADGSRVRIIGEADAAAEEGI